MRAAANIASYPFLPPPPKPPPTPLFRPVILDRTILAESSSNNFILMERERRKFDILATKNSFMRFDGSLGKFLAKSEIVHSILNY